MEFYNEKDYAGALALATREMANFPDAAQDIAWWRVCMAAQVGEKELALSVFREALDRGFWYPPETLRSDPDIAAIRDEPEFARLAEICRERATAARANAKPNCLTVEPVTGATDRLLLALHGNGGSARGTVEHWRPLSRKGWHLALPDSSQIAGPDAHLWEDWEWAESEIARHYQAQVAQHGLTADQVVVGGLSMGAGLSIWLPLKGAIGAKGFIAVAPWLQSHDIRPLLEQRARQNQQGQNQQGQNGGQHVAAPLRGYMIVGDQDTWCYPLAQECKALFDQYGLPCQLEVVPGLGHTYPDGFEAYLERALAFIYA